MAVSSEAENQANLTDRHAAETNVAFDGSIRARLMHAMAAVVAHGGYRDASIERVLEQAHVGWEEFTCEFDDLDDCLLATLDAGIDCALRATERAMVAAKPPTDAQSAFDAGLVALLDLVVSNPQLANLCLVESAALGARGVELKEAGLQRLAGLLRRSGMPDENLEAAPSLAAEMVAGGIYEVIQRKVRAGELAELPQLATELSQLWLPVIRSRPG
jgi:hypothetical protein